MQTLFILLGVLLTAANLRVHAFPDQPLNLNPTAVAVRDFGFFLLIIPVVWSIACVLLERNNSNRWSPFMTLASGLALIALLGGLFYWTVTTPVFYHKMPIQSWTQ